MPGGGGSRPKITALSGNKINVIGYGIVTILLEVGNDFIVSCNLSGRTFKVEKNKTESV